MRIDVHAHYYPNAYLDLLERFGFDTRDTPRSLPASEAQPHLEARFKMMDKAGVAIQILSVSSLLAYFADKDHAISAARRANDLYAEIAARYPQRFKAFAITPLPFIDESLKEIERAIDQLGMAGVTVGSTALGRSVADSAFDPFFAELNRRGCVLFMHPAGVGACSPLVRDSGLSWPIGAPIEDTVFALHLIKNGIPQRFPAIKIIIPHLGGLLPLALPRLDDHAPLFLSEKTEAPSRTALRLWYDTVGHGSLAAIRCAHAAFGAERLVYGSDYPFQLDEKYLRSVTYIQDAGFPEGDAERILDRNAAALFEWTD